MLTIGILPILPCASVGDPEMCGAIGVSLYIAVQNLKASHNGLPKAIRNNSTQMVLVGKTKDSSELKDIYESVSGEVSEEDFYKCYEYATAEKHNSLCIDLNPKKPQYKFRKISTSTNLIDFKMPSTPRKYIPRDYPHYFITLILPYFWAK